MATSVKTKSMKATSTVAKSTKATTTPPKEAWDFAIGDEVEITRLWANAPKTVSVGYTFTLPQANTMIKNGQTFLVTRHVPKVEKKGYMLEALEIPVSCVKVVRRISKKSKSSYPYYSSPSAYSSKPSKVVDYDALTDNQKYFADLIMAKNRKEVINLALEGVDINKFDFYMDKMDDTHEYFVMVPKGAKGKLPMLMAHTDVHPNITSPTKKTLFFEDGVFAGSQGLGADDRAGIYTINQVLRKHPDKFIVGFFDKEEVGCVGSTKFANSKDFKAVNKLASAFISVDRRRSPQGGKAIAIYGEDNQELFDLVKKATGRGTVRGSVTDCAKLARKSGDLKKPVACFNFSCGYENEHRAHETLHWSELEETVEDVEKLLTIKELWEKAFTFKPTPIYSPKTTKARRSSYGYYGAYQTDDYLIVDNEIVEADDVEKLIALVRYYTGKRFYMDRLDGMYNSVIFSVGEEVQLHPDCKIGQRAGDIILSESLYHELRVGTWEIDVVDEETMLVSLSSTDERAVADNIPMQWLSAVTMMTPVVTYN